MIITKTPFRISLFGGGSDHPKWFSKYGGKVVSFAINKYCYLSTRILPPFFDHHYRIAYSIVETEKNFESIKHPAVREAIRKYAPELRLEIHHDGDLPARSGVGSSSAFAVGIIHSLLGLQGKNPDNNLLADLAIQLEHDILKENVGWQDQIACAIGGLNYLEFSTSLSWRAESISLSKSYLDAIESRIALVYTGISRNSSDINATLLTGLEKKQNLLGELINMADVCRNHFTAEDGDLDVIGEMLDQSWNLKRSLNKEATNSELDNFYSKGKAAGAIGGKILGAGGGGFFLFWLKEGGKADFSSRFKLGTHIPIKISQQGSSIVYRSPESNF